MDTAARVLSHEGLELWSTRTQDKFFVVPTDPSTDEALEIDRLNFDLRLITKREINLSDYEKKKICALMGIIHLVAGPYLIVAVKSKVVGTIDGCMIHEMTESEVIPFTKTTIHLSEPQEKDNEAYLAMIRRVLATPGFYFSHRVDLTNSLQRVQQNFQTKGSTFASLPLHERADERFLWNGYLLRDLVVLPELRRFIMPFIMGNVSISHCSVNGKTFVFTLISRRSAKRAGVRYYMRGVDEDGNVANYVETEQIISYNGHKASFIQTRGSIPLYWSQCPTLKYKPAPRVDTSADHKAAMQKHFDEQIVYYGQQVVVNLIDQKGSEKNLGDTFTRVITSMSSCLLSYDAFDFHKECSKMRWHRLSILIDRLMPKLSEFGYFMTDPQGTVVCVQQGVFRTNCIDCLDRTNVVQSMLAHICLEFQLKRLSILGPNEKLDTKRAFETVFKNVWADNADMCAKQYAGTGALKTDFTRTGKRTFVGMLHDGYNSAIRYVYNNFSDGFRQDSISLFLGSHEVDRWEGIVSPSPLHTERSWRYRTLPIILLLGLSMLFMTLILPSTNSLFQLLYVAFWGAAVIGTLAYLYRYGPEFVDAPKLGKKRK